jgi:hypothetical protein
LLWEEDILTFIYTSLPDIQSHWQSFGVPLKDEAITGWFDWLATNHKHGSRLNDAFAA